MEPKPKKVSYADDLRSLHEKIDRILDILNPNKQSETILHWDGKDTVVTDKAVYQTQNSIPDDPSVMPPRNPPDGEY